MNNQQEIPKKEATPEKVESKMSNRQKVRLVLTTLLIVLLVIFVYQNANKVEVEFLTLNFKVRIVMIILVSSLIGSLITYLLMKHKTNKKK